MNIILKIKSKSGESITETLAATLIAAMSMIIFASMVIASKSIISQSNDQMDYYYEWNSKMLVQDSEIDDSESATITFSEALISNKTNFSGITIYKNKSSDVEESENTLIRSY